MPLSDRQRRFLLLTALVCGMAVMALELAATRLLAPYFGTSMVIWTVVISFFLLAISAGNVLGGRLADRAPDGHRFFTLLTTAAIWLALVPVLGRYLLAVTGIALVWICPHHLLVVGSALCCLVLFTWPFVILGMASPVLIRCGMTGLDDAGAWTGRVQAVGTIGSVIGTCLPVFVTLPTIGTARTFFVFALALLALRIGHAWLFGARAGRTTVAGAVVTIALMIAPVPYAAAFWTTPLYEGESPYNYIQVNNDRGDDSVTFSTHVAVGMQSIYRPEHGISGAYYEHALAAAFTGPDVGFATPLRTLVIGLGTGTFSRQCRHFFGGSDNDGVEIDPEVVRLARKYFALTDRDTRIHVEDGRTWIRHAATGTYDLILVDAYRDITFPFHLCTREFFAEVATRLAPTGVIVINFNLRTGGANALYEAMVATLQSVMPTVWGCDTPDSTNTLIIATRDGETVVRDRLRTNVARLAEESAMTPIAQRFAENLRLLPPAKVPAMTDDLAPVELYGQQAADALIAKTIAEVLASMPALLGSGTPSTPATR